MFRNILVNQKSVSKATSTSIGDKIQVGINEQNHIAKKGIVSTDTFKSYLP